MSKTITLTKYKYEKQNVGTKEFVIPTETEYYFQTGIRRSIRIKPVYTTWNMEMNGTEEEPYELEFTFVYQHWQECKLEKLSLRISDLEEMYYNNGKSDFVEFIKQWIDFGFDKRTKEMFENDFNTVLEKLKE